MQRHYAQSNLTIWPGHAYVQSQTTYSILLRTPPLQLWEDVALTCAIHEEHNLRGPVEGCVVHLAGVDGDVIGEVDGVVPLLWYHRQAAAQKPDGRSGGSLKD